MRGSVPVCKSGKIGIMRVSVGGSKVFETVFTDVGFGWLKVFGRME